MSRIKITDNGFDILEKLADGNPGALTALYQFINASYGDNGDLYIARCFETFFIIDMMELYGSHLYMLWNDCCNRDTKKFLKVIEGYREGKIKKSDLNERIFNVGYGKSFDDLLEKIV